MVDRPQPTADGAAPPDAPAPAEDRRVGGREVALLGLGAAAVGLGAAALTSLLPEDLQRVVFHTPLLIVILLVGTAGLLWRLARRGATG